MTMTGKSIGRSGDRLYAYSLYAAVLSGAGLPIYIYAPKFFAENYGVSLTALGAILFGLRLFDVVQDPVLGWISERLGTARRVSMAVVAGVLALSMFGLFAVPPVGGPLIWFALTITGLFSAFSFLTINFYALGIAKAAAIKGGHVRLAGWRETGALFGVCLAAVAPTLLLGVVADPFATFAIGFAGVTLWAAFLMDREWCSTSSDADTAPTPTSVILRDPIARSLLILAMVNAAPLAVSSTLFLFFVESRLDAPGWEGPLLVLFLVSGCFRAGVEPVGGCFWTQAGVAVCHGACGCVFWFCAASGGRRCHCLCAGVHCVGRNDRCRSCASSCAVCRAHVCYCAQGRAGVRPLGFYVEVHAGFRGCGLVAAARTGRVFGGRSCKPRRCPELADDALRSCALRAETGGYRFAACHTFEKRDLSYGNCILYCSGRRLGCGLSYAKNEVLGFSRATARGV
jgi:MFS family permease